MNKITLHLIILLTLFCCQSSEEKFINAEFNKIQGHWLINSFENRTTIPNATGGSIAKRLKTGEMILNNCKYTEKSFSVPGRSCGGNFQINGYLYGLSYQYDYASKLYTISLSVPHGTNGKPLDDAFDKSLIDLLYGEWTLEVFDNQLKATQRKGFNDFNTLVSFTATRK
ncbi:MAG: hypothetical protein ACK4GN_05155 [Runella sp.]